MTKATHGANTSRCSAPTTYSRWLQLGDQVLLVVKKATFFAKAKAALSLEPLCKMYVVIISLLGRLDVMKIMKRSIFMTTKLGIYDYSLYEIGTFLT